MTGRTAKQLDIVAFVVILLAAAALAATWPSSRPNSPTTDQSTLVNATVSSISPCSANAEGSSCAALDVEPTTGVHAGQVFRINEVRDVSFSVGDEIVLRSADPADGGFRYSYEDHQRLPLLAIVGALVAVGLVLVGWRHGLRSMVALAAIAALLYFYTLPALANDPSSPTTGIVTSVVAAMVVIFVTGGVTSRRTIATLGSIVALGSVAGLTWLVYLLGELPTDLLMTGVTIGSTGAVIALATSQVDATFDQRSANTTRSIPRLMRRSIATNQPTVGSTLMTLVFANLGAGIAALVMFASANQSALQTLNSAHVATIALALLVGIAGMLLAIPVSAALAASLTAEATTVEEIIVLDDRPPVKRTTSTPDAPRRQRVPAVARPKIEAGQPSLWERMRQGLDD